jgi:hypothetical protein
VDPYTIEMGIELLFGHPNPNAAIPHIPLEGKISYV